VAYLRDTERVPELLCKCGGLSDEAAQEVSGLTGVPAAHVWGTATFYSMLRSKSGTTRVCNGLSCRLAGSDELAARLKAEGCEVEETGCLGRCDHAPSALNADLGVLGAPERAGAVVEDSPELPINLAGSCDHSGPAAKRARAIGPQAVIDTVEHSQLRGRGGAGFPAHAKWRAVADRTEETCYLICNADEGEPGTFKDREILLRRPDLVVEGLVIAGEAVGATEVIVYIRGEFEDARVSLERELGRAEYLGDTPVRIVSGHGAYICGEETALLEALEGKRGMPRMKPPFPTASGFRNFPTLIHNVETLACIPSIIMRGPEWFQAQGREEAGTKLYCLSGHVAHPGVYELPLGATLDELVAVAGGYLGVPIAFCPGGASSGFLPMSERARPLDFGNLAQVGSMLGSAGVVVLNDTVDMAEAALWQLSFFEAESCGQCAPCRIGTRYLREALRRYLATGDPSALDDVDDVAWELEEASLCGLGMVAGGPLVSARRHFADSFAWRTPALQGGISA
jgi:NADH:ubiquinone oxidoreductase subunit F (NADH-binding)